MSASSEPTMEHSGFFAERLAHESGEAERAFADRWKYYNEHFHVLQHLTQREKGSPFAGAFRFEPIIELTPRDAAVAATVVQWLGSNVGQGFLAEACALFGAKIITKNGFQL